MRRPRDRRRGRPSGTRSGRQRRPRPPARARKARSAGRSSTTSADAAPAFSSSRATWPTPPPISSTLAPSTPRVPARRASERAIGSGPRRRYFRASFGRASSRRRTPPGRGGRSSRSLRTPPEVAARDHRHHRDAVLVDHLAADPDRAAIRAPLGRRRLQHRQPPAQRVARPDRREPAKLLDPGRALADAAPSIEST